MRIPEILDDYQIEEADVRACVAYGSEMARERYVTPWIVEPSRLREYQPDN